MFVVNEDNSIYVTRGDILFFSVSAEDRETKEKYTFKAGDVLRIKVYGKKAAENVVLQKDFPVTENTSEVEIFLTEEDTKIDEVISKPKDYWYEVELNPDEAPQTIIGYDDENGPVLFKLFPEGADIENYEPDPEDFPVVDEELNLNSPRPVANRVIARAFINLEAGYNACFDAVSKLHVTPQMYGAVGDGVADDTEAIVKALAENNLVYLPEGKYMITSEIEIPENKTLQLAGKIISLSGKELSDFSGVAIVVCDGDARISMNTDSKLIGGIVYAPTSAKAIQIDVGKKTLKNIEITSAILGERTEGSTGIYFDGSTGTVGSLCFSKFSSAIHGFERGYFVDRASGNLPWFTFCNFTGVLSENYKAFTHNLTSYGNAFGSSYFGFTVCGGYKWKNSATALLEMIGDNLTVDCKFSDVGSGHNHVYGMDIAHVQKSTFHNIPFQSPLIVTASKNRNNFTFGEMGTVTNEHGTLSYIVNGMVAHVFYTGNVPVGSTYMDVPFSCLAFAKTVNGNTSIETQQHFPKVVLKNSGTGIAEGVNLMLSIIIH